MKQRYRKNLLAFLMTLIMLSFVHAAAEQPVEQRLPDADRTHQAELTQNAAEQAGKILRIVLGMTGNDPAGDREWMVSQVQSLLKNPGQYSVDFLDSLFGTGAEGISRETDSEKKGRIEFVMPLPEPVSMPDCYSVTYHRLDSQNREIITMLERDADGNIHYRDGNSEQVFVRTEDGFRMYPVLPDQAGFGKWDGIRLSARSVREKTAQFWNCADQAFMMWSGAHLTETTEYLNRPCGLYHAETGAMTFSYQCDMIIDDETGICLHYQADELLRGFTFRITQDSRLEIDVGDYDIGGDEMSFFCSDFRTDNISFELP